MTGTTDEKRAQQRMAHLILGDLLDLGLPLAQWSVNAQADWWRRDPVTGLDAWISREHCGVETDAEVAAALIDWARYFRVQIQADPPKSHGGYWRLSTQVQGVPVEMFARMSQEYMSAHEPPLLASLLAKDRADMYVRRSSGELVEAVNPR